MEHLSVDGGTTLSRSLQRGSLQKGSLQRAVWSPHRHRLGLSERAGKLPCLTPHHTENSDLHFTSTPESMRYSHWQGQIWSCRGEVILVNKFPALDRYGGGPDGQWGADDYRKSMMAEESVRQNSEKVRVLSPWWGRKRKSEGEEGLKNESVSRARRATEGTLWAEPRRGATARMCKELIEVNNSKVLLQFYICFVSENKSNFFPF